MVGTDEYKRQIPKMHGETTIGVARLAELRAAADLLARVREGADNVKVWHDFPGPNARLCLFGPEPLVSELAEALRRE